MIDNNEIINEVIESNLSTNTKRILIQMLTRETLETDSPKVDFVLNTMGKVGIPCTDDLPFIFKKPKVDKDAQSLADIKIEPVGDN